MPQLASLTGTINVDGAAQAVANLRLIANQFAATGTAASGASAPVESLLGSLLKFEGIKRGVDALVGLGQATVQSYADTERLGASLTALVAKESLASGQASNMGQALAGASGKAKELLGWTQQLAIDSPFSQEGVAQAFKMAQAYGFVSETADKADVDAKRLTQSLIDFSSGAGQSEASMSRIALALGQMQAKGKVAGGEMLQLTEAGLNVRSILANAFKVTTAELVKMQEKGLIPADRAIKAIVESLENDFGGAAKRQSGTMAGLMNSLEDLKTVGLREFFTGTFQAIQPLLQTFTNTLGDPQIIANIRGWGQALGSTVQVGAGAIQFLVTNVSALLPLIAGVTVGLVAFKAAQIAVAISTGLANGSLALQAATLLGNAAAYLTANAAALMFAGSVAAVAAAWFLAYQKYQQYQGQLDAGAQATVQTLRGYTELTDAVARYNDATVGTQVVTKGQVTALNDLETAQAAAIRALAETKVAGIAARQTGEQYAAGLQAQRDAINDRSTAIQNAAASLQNAITTEELEANRLQISTQLRIAATATTGEFVAAIQAQIGATQASAETSMIDTAAKDAQKAQIALMQGQVKLAADAFLALNPNISQSGVASAIAAGQISESVGKYIAMTLAAAAARAELARLQAQAGQTPAVKAMQAANPGDVGRYITQGQTADPAAGKAAVERLRALNAQEKDRAAALRDQAMATGSAAQKQAILNKEYQTATRTYGDSSAQSTRAKTALDQYTASQVKSAGAGAAKTSQGEKDAKKQEKLTETTAKKLVDIEQATAKKLVDIDKRMIAERMRAYKQLATSILTTSADMVQQQEANDLELVGMTEEQLSAARPREQAEAKARVAEAEAVKEARINAEQQGADYATQVYDQRQKQIGDQQQLDQQYAERQAELAGNKPALDQLKQQYDEATAAIEQSTQIRLDLAQQAADEQKAKAQEEKDAVIAAAQEQAAAVENASESQRATVVGALAAQASAASGWANSVQAASSRVISAANAAAGAIRNIPAPSSGGGESGGGTGSAPTARARGGSTNVGRVTLVGEEGPELVVFNQQGTIYPADRTRQMVAGGMAEGGAILDPSKTNPTNAPSTAPGSGKKGGKKKSGLTPEQIAAQMLAAAVAYTEAEKKLKADARARQLALDEEQYQAELVLKKEHLPAVRAQEEQRYVEERNIKRLNRDRERVLEAQFATEAKARQGAVLSQKTRDDTAATRRYYDAVTANQEVYRGQLATLQDKAQQTTGETANFWLTAQASLLNDQMAARNVQAHDALEGELAQNEQAQTEKTAQVNQAIADAEDERREDLRHQMDSEQQVRDDGWDVQREKLKHAQDSQDEVLSYHFGERNDRLKQQLDNEQKAFDKAWENVFKAIKGGLDELAKIKSGTSTIAPVTSLPPARASGGPVSAGQAYIVGEKRAELFVPNQNGTILPSVPRGGSGGGAPTINLNLAVDARGSTLTEQQIKRTVEEAVRKLLDEVGRRAYTLTQFGSRR